MISLVVGSLMLFESPDPAMRVSLQVMIPTLVVICLFLSASSCSSSGPRCASRGQGRRA